MESHSVAQSGHESAKILLPKPPMYCEHNHASKVIITEEKIPELIDVTKKNNQWRINIYNI